MWREWISVNDERKPRLAHDEKSISEDVLLYVPDFARAPWGQAVVMGNYLHSSRKFRPDGSSGWEDKVTHWMPLPNPPEAQP